VELDEHFAVGFIGLKRVRGGVHAEFALIKLTPPVAWNLAVARPQAELTFSFKFLDDRGGRYETSFSTEYEEYSVALQLPRGFVWRVSESTSIPLIAFGHITTVAINGRQVEPLGEGFRWDNRRITGDNVVEFGAERRSVKLPQLALTPLGSKPENEGICMLVRFRNLGYSDVEFPYPDVSPDDPGGWSLGRPLTIPGDQSSEVCVDTGAYLESAADIQTYLLVLGGPAEEPSQPELFLIPDREAVGSRLVPPVVEVAYREHCAECGMEVTVRKIQLPPGRFRAELTIKNTGERGTITLPGYALRDVSTVFMFDEAQASAFRRQFNELGLQSVLTQLDRLLENSRSDSIYFGEGDFPSPELKPGESVSGWLIEGGAQSVLIQWLSYCGWAHLRRKLPMLPGAKN